MWLFIGREGRGSLSRKKLMLALGGITREYFVSSSRLVHLVLAGTMLQSKALSAFRVFAFFFLCTAYQANTVASKFAVT